MYVAGSSNHHVKRRLPGPSSIGHGQNGISTTSRLRDREIFGICKKSAKFTSSSKQAFAVLPRRFAFPLTSIVDDVFLKDDGHVFLGFSSCDQFLLSYTERIEEARHTGFLSHIYTLYWWVWNPGKKAKKIGSMRLFANEEIEYSLFLSYAEWPTLKSQIVVYGWRKFCDSCYITIATVPPLTNCKRCDSLPSIIAASPDEGDENIKPSIRCIEHGYSVHFKQASGASQAGVLNTSGLKIDGVLVLNIGHSIAVLCTGYLQKQSDLENLPLSTIKRSACEDTVMDHETAEATEHPIEEPATSSEIFSSGESFTPRDSSQNILSDSSSFTESGNVINCQDICNLSQDDYMHSQSAIPNPPPKSSVYDLDSIEHDTCVEISLSQSNISLENKENILASHREEVECEVSVNLDPYFDPEPKSIILGGRQAACKESKSFRNPEGRTCRMCGCLIASCCVKSLVEIRKAGAKICDCTMQISICETDSSTRTTFDHSGAVRNKSFLSPTISSFIPSEKQNSRSELNFVTPSPTASDGSSSVQFSNDANFSSSTVKCSNSDRRSDGLVSFTESFYGPINPQNVTPEDPLPVGETSLHYCSMFCQGAGGEMLHPLEKEDESVQAFSQHLVLDLEHVIFDILRTRCYVAYKFGYLVDYEANIMDVCSSTRSVIIHVAALLDMQRNRSKLPPIGLAEKASGFSQQAEFILSWSLSTGRYEVVVARPLQSYDKGKSGEWKGDWIVKADAAIKQQCAVKTNPYKTVYIMDNSAVLRLRSLKVLWNCDKTLAITK